MTSILLTPIDLSDARKVGKRRFRKQILAIRDLDYKGQKIRFDRSFMTDLSRSFASGAYDQVPFVLANEKNEHHMDPKLFEGEMVGVVPTKDGLDAILELTPEGAALVEKNPRLGVSARIVQGLVKNGRTYKRAIQHVLATMDPRMTGLRPWQAIDLSGSEQFEVVDLTAETYSGRKQDMAKGNLRLGVIDPKAKTATIDLSSLSDDDFEALLDLGETDEVEIDPKTGKPKVIPAADAEVDPDEIEDPDAELEADEDEIDPDQEGAVVPSTGEVPPARSGPKKRKTTTTVEEEALEQGTELAALSNRFAEFEREKAGNEGKNRRGDLARLGVPPFMLDLAEPVVASPDAMVIDLSASGGSKVDPKDIINKMLDGMAGIVDLTPEQGHWVDLSNAGGQNDPDAALLKEWSAQYGD